MINLTVYLYDADSGLGRGIRKNFQRQILPRIGEDVSFYKQGATAEVTKIWHNFDNEGDVPMIEVKCENVPIHHLRNLYKAGGWELYDTTKEDLFDDGYGKEFNEIIEVEPQSDHREPPLVTVSQRLQ